MPHFCSFLKVNEMEKSCKFYSKIPGFKLVYGGTRNDTFATYQLGEGNKKAYLNLEVAEETPERLRIADFGRIIFHTENVVNFICTSKETKIFRGTLTLKLNLLMHHGERGSFIYESIVVIS
jgi:hypothetical protein